MRIHLLYILPFFIIACNDEETPVKKDAALTPNQEKTRAAMNPPVAQTFDNNVGRFSSEEGAVGVFEVGQMLALSIIDSAEMQNVANEAAKAYELIEEDLKSIGIEPDGPLGQITYNNNPLNFKFECVVLIKKMPAKEPVHSKIVVLEASHMLVYNYYGSYHELYKGYAKVRQTLGQKGFVQSAPVREFYMNDPTIVKEPSKWRTLIMVPVRAKIQ
jgi:effector-binding domain-containing protein